MDYAFSTKTQGIGGVIKRRIADFVVRERTVDGTLCEVLAFTDTEKLETEKNYPEIEEDKDQLICDLEKYNSDTNFVVNRLSRMLGVSRKRIGYAGMKDKRAITCQRISIWKPDLERLANINSRYVDIRPLFWSNNRIDIGDLTSNYFEIVVRDLDKKKAEIEKIIKDFSEQTKNGVANYFGEQRFGGARQITHQVGKELLKGNTETGVMLYLTSTFPKEEEEIKQARMNLAKTQDFSQAIREFPTKFRYERAIIHHLCKYPKDFVGAFSKLPKNLKYMFTHAYQSYLFNKLINKRLADGIGLEPIDGDIVENSEVMGPLFGYELELAKGKAGELEQHILEEENLDISEFKIKQIPEISSKGTRKAIKVTPKNFELKEISEDEFNEGKLKAKICFELSKGNYATTILKELMK